ncbi:hypothetical protein D3C80_1507460 [compost metagenome]
MRFSRISMRTRFERLAIPWGKCVRPVLRKFNQRSLVNPLRVKVRPNGLWDRSMYSKFVALAKVAAWLVLNTIRLLVRVS